MHKETKEELQSIAQDVVGISGAILMTYGAWLAYRPAGFMLAGALLLYGAIRDARGQQLAKRAP